MTARHLSQTIFGFGFAAAFFYLPINLCHTIYASGPFLVLTLDYLIYKVKVSPRQGIGIVVSFAGVLLTIQGPYLYHLIDPTFQITTEFQNYKP